MAELKIPTRQENGCEGSPVTSRDWTDWEIDRYKQNTEYRKNLTRWVMWTSVCWLGFVAVILVLNSSINGFVLSDAVLAVLLGTTTANVLGLALIVLKGMFSGSE